MKTTKQIKHLVEEIASVAYKTPVKDNNSSKESLLLKRFI